MEILLFGAGASGRGHLSIQIRNVSDAQITYVDKNVELIKALKDTGSYRVRLLSLSGSERTVTINNFYSLERDNEEAIVDAFIKTDLVLTCVIAENLENISAIIAKGIEMRMQIKNSKPLNIIACENLNNASLFLEKLTYKHLSIEAIKFAELNIGFPDAMISCVVPVPTDDLFLVAEDYNEWVVRKSKFKGKITDFKFLDVIDNFDAYLERKLWIHNGGHATVAYAGYPLGYKYIHEAVLDKQVAEFAVSVIHQIGDVIIHKYGFDLNETREYEADFCNRGLITEMKDSLLRVVRDPLRKLGRSDRLMGPALYAYNNGLPYDLILRALINITLYKNNADMEAEQIQRDIELYGFEKFCETTLGLIEYPEFIKEFADLRRSIMV